MPLNHDGWGEIFEQLRIVERVNTAGFHDITAHQIKRISQREPRLMAKVDFREQLPPVMEEEGLAILAIANGTYRIGRFDPFINIETRTQATVERITFPDNILTLNPKELAHEAAALDAALLSGILKRVFGEDVNLTIRGRSRNAPFSFALNNIQFPVDGVQIEVDCGYEGATTVNLVEAKVGARSNISVRQLLYPQLAWQSAIRRRKTVKSFVCFYQEPVLRFIPVLYESNICRVEHEKELAFALEPEARLELTAIPVRPDAPIPVLKVPFPQADNFETVLAMFSVVAQNDEGITKEDLFRDFDIPLVKRQIDYYSNAMRWLGLVEVDDGVLRVTTEGRRIAGLTHAQRIKELAWIIFSEPIFHRALRHGSNNFPHSLFQRWRCNDSTINRRLQTVVAWMRYFQTFEQTR